MSDDTTKTTPTDEIEIDDDTLAGGVDLTRFTREGIRAMSAEDLRRLIKQGYEADRLREQRDKAQDEALAALIEALDDKEAEAQARHNAEIDAIRKEKDEAKALISYKSSTSAEVNLPKGLRAAAADRTYTLLAMVVLLVVGGVFGGTRINLSSESTATATAVSAESIGEAAISSGAYYVMDAEGQQLVREAVGYDPEGE